MAAWLGWLRLGMCFWGSAYAPRNGGIEMDHPSLISSPWGQLMRAWCLNTKKACWFNLFIHSFVRLATSQMTSLAALWHAEFALNGGSIYIILCNSQNDWFPWGNCMIFMPLLECNLKSDSLFIVSDISRNDCFLEEECLTLKSLARDWFKELGCIHIAIQKSEWLLSLRKLFGIYALAHD